MGTTPLATPASQETADAIGHSISLIRGEVGETADRINEQELALLAAHLTTVNRVFVAGAGRSGLVLRMAAMRLMHLGLTVHIAGDTTTPAIRAEDLLVVASGSGTTSSVVKAAETAAKAGAKVAAFTANIDSPLAAVTDMLVVIRPFADERG